MEILLIHSSGYGSTKEIADRIACTLCQDNFPNIKIAKLDDVQNISNYDTIIIGGSIRAGNITANVQDFILANQNELAKKNTILFLSGILAWNSDSRINLKENIVLPFISKLHRLQLMDIQIFGGRIELSRLNFVMRSYMESLLQNNNIPVHPIVDTRNWDEIDAWANSLKRMLRHAA